MRHTFNKVRNCTRVQRLTGDLKRNKACNGTLATENLEPNIKKIDFAVY